MRLFARFVSAALICVLLLSASPAAFAWNSVGGDRTEGVWEYNLDGSVRKYNGSSSTVTIPTTLGRTKITSVATGCFYEANTVKTIYVPDQITRISERAFANCASVKKVVFRGERVFSFGSGAFENCTSLESVTLPDYVGDSLGYSTFANCTSLKSVTLPSSIDTIHPKTFLNCTSLKTIEIPLRVHSVDSRAFVGCTKLDGIWVADGHYSFCNDSRGVLFKKNMTELIAAPGSISGHYDIPDSVTELHNYAFAGCSELESVSIPEGISRLDADEFSDCTALKEIYFYGSPWFWADPFLNVTANAYYYPYYIHETYAGWHSGKLADHGGDLTWIPVDIPCDRAIPRLTVSLDPTTSRQLLTWDAIPTAQEYEVYRADSQDSEYSLIYTTADTRYLDSDSVRGQDYFYKICGVAADGTVSKFSEVEVGVAVLPAPSSVSAAFDLETGHVTVTWEPVEGVTSYTVVRTWDETSDMLFYEGETTATSYTDTNPQLGSEYTYAVRSICDYFDGNSGYSELVTVYCGLPEPKVRALPGADDAITVSWQNIEGAVCYEVFRSLSADGPYERLNSVTSNSYCDTAIVHGTRYYYQVQAICDVAEASSQYSSPVSAVAGGSPFPDVGKNHSFKDYILWGYYSGIVGGDKQGNFNPENTVTRGQFILMLWRAAGKPEPTQYSAFPDVTENSSFYTAVCWAAEQGITKGNKDGSFGVNDPCTRGHVALFLYRYAGSPEVSGEITFPDVTGGTYYDAVCWAAQSGITSGQKDGTFGAGNPCKRMHAMKFLYLFLNEA